MPLFNLTSFGKTNHAKFENYFNDTVTLKAYSEIALVGAQIARKNENQRIIVPPDTILMVRFNPYDLFPVTLNAAGTANLSLTLTELATAFNGLVPDNTALLRGCRMIVETNDPEEDDNARFNFFYTVNNKDDYETFMYDGNANYKRQYWNLITGQNLPIFGPGNTGINNNQPSIKGDLANTSYAIAMGFDLNKYAPPVNQINNHVFNLQLEQFELENQNQWILGQPSLKTISISLGKATNSDPTTVSTGPVIGTPGYDNPGGEPGNLLFNIEYRPDGNAEIKVFNTNTQNMTQIVLSDYEPGELWELMCVKTSPNGPRSQGYFRLGRKKSNGLAYYFPNMPTTPANHWYNNPNSKAVGVALNLFYSLSLTGTGAYAEALFNANDMKNLRITGPRACSGFDGDLSGEAQANTPEVVNARYFNNQAGPDVFEGYVHAGVGLPIYNGAVAIRRYDPTEAPNAIPQRRDIFQLTEENQPLVTDAPFMIGMFFYLINDTAQVLPALAPQIQTLISSDLNANSPVVQLYPGATPGKDVRLTMKDASQLDFILLELDSGTRININTNTDYYITIEYIGTALNNIRVTLTQLVVNQTLGGNNGIYQATVATGGQTLHNLGYIGGPKQTIAANYDLRGAFFFADFRFYTKNDYATNTVDLWITPMTQLAYYNQTGTKASGSYYFTVENIEPYQVLVPQATAPLGSEPEYRNIGFMRPEETVSVVVQRDNTASYDPNWYDFQNFYFRPCTIMPNAARFLGLDASAYAGAQEGLVAVDPELTQEPPGLEFVDPTPDANGDCLNFNTGNPKLVGENNATSRILFTTDYIRNQDKVMDIQITNLPHRSYNGYNHMNDKTIYRVLMRGDENVEVLNDVRILEIDVPERTYIPLNNPTEMTINQLEVLITDVEGKEENDLTEDTYVSIDIK
tara:strand:- start:3520 stop:6270 length:2751 start_codon:yes stop_codon:yes gene_type:complete